jgi:nitrogen PTS system EIIA component
MKLGVEEAARMLHVSTKTIYRWVSTGKIPGYRVHKQYRFDRTELLEWAQAQRLPVTELVPFEPDPPAPAFDQAIEEGGVHYRIGGSTRDEVLRQVVLALRLVVESDRDLLQQALVAREDLAPTTIGDGFAIPHLRNPLRLDIPRATVSLCYLEAPVDWNAPDGTPVHTLFVVVGPTVRSVLRLHIETLFSLRDATFRLAVEAHAPREQLFEHARRLASSFRRGLSK